MIENWGVRGLTSNPTIFDNAISSSDIYDEAISRLKAQNLPTEKLFEELAIDDIGEAADLLLPVYEESGGNDGFVSIEVSPLLARDTQATIDQALSLSSRLSRPNIMVKVPGTDEGIPAVRALLEEGVNINITLLFSVENYVAVANTYCEAMRARLKKGLPVEKIRSVASFFVSRVDTAVDKQLNSFIEGQTDAQRAEEARALLGQFGIANSRVAYSRYREIFEGPGFDDLKSAGVAAQRPLWASTSVKNPEYPELMYIEQLIGQNTVNTMPHHTLEAFVDHGRVQETIFDDLPAALEMSKTLASYGVDTNAVLAQLQVEGVKKFSDSFVALNETIKQKLS